MIVNNIERLKPILKWAGGKEKELNHILPNIPKDFNRYFEPFVGGGAVYFSIHIDNLNINDKSEELVNLYRQIKEQNSTFFQKMDSIEEGWVSLETHVEKHSKELSTIYREYSNNLCKDEDMKINVENFVNKNEEEFTVLVSELFDINNIGFLNEIRKNLKSKFARMRTIEDSKGKLNDADLYDNIECAFKSAYYMYFRELYNNIENFNIDKSFEAAIFYFIRELCYSSMFRYNKNGQFNVPYGGISYNRKNLKKKIDYLKSEDLHKHLFKTKIHNDDFENFLNKYDLCEKDFIFLDPPYDSDFSTYAKNIFDREAQIRLAQYLYKTKAKFMLVIKNTDFIYELYKEKFNIQVFDKNYLVSFQNRNEKKVKHLIITNY